MSRQVTILGGGSWGMAVARLLDKQGLHVTLWEGLPDEYHKLRTQRAIPEKLADFILPESVVVSNDLIQALDHCQLLVLAIPAQYLAGVLRDAAPHIPRGIGVVNLAKGIETTTLRRMSEVICDEAEIEPGWVVTLSGPSHAEEVVRDIPTTVVAAGTGASLVGEVQHLFSSAAFRVYSSDDLIGVELGGALKNIVAIGVGIADGLGMGDNTRGALITRGLAEITRLGLACGARAETFAGLSGIGDLITTCTSRHSRNRFVGEQVGRGRPLPEVVRSMTMIAEGVDTTKAGRRLAAIKGVEMPITEQVFQVLFENKPPSLAVGELMGRQLKAEVW